MVNEPEIQHTRNKVKILIQNYDFHNEVEENNCKICKLKSFKSFCGNCVRKFLMTTTFPRYSSGSYSKIIHYENLAYMAPEIIYGRQHTPESDVYSFGIILSEILSGKVPYYGYEHNRDLAVKVLVGMRPKILQEIPSEYSGYHELINQCLDAIPSNRPTLISVLEKLKIDKKNIINNSQSSRSSYAMSESKFKDLPEPRNATKGEEYKLLFSL